MKVTQQRAREMYEIVENYVFSADELTSSQQKKLALVKERYGFKEQTFLNAVNAVKSGEPDYNAAGKPVPGSEERKKRKALADAGLAPGQVTAFLNVMKSK